MRRLARVLPFPRSYRPRTLGVVLFTVGATVVNLLAPWLVRELTR